MLFSGELYKLGWDTIVDLERSAELYRMACKLNNAFGCFELGVSYFLRIGVEENPSLGVKYCKQGCDGKNYHTCNFGNQKACLKIEN